MKCIGYALLAMLGFGITNYLIGYATSYLQTSVETFYAVGAEWKMMVILWLSGGVPGLLCYLFHWIRVRKVEFFWAEVDEISPRITASSKLLTLAGGVGLGVSVSLMKKAFVFSSPADKGKSPSSYFDCPSDPAGPISAIVGSTIIIVSLYGHFVFRELLSKRHAVLIGIVITGVLISAFGPGGPTQVENRAAAEETTGHTALGFAFAILSMIGMAATTILIRYSSLGHVSTWSGYSARLLAQSALALVVGYMFVKSEDGGALPVTVLPNEVVTLSVIAGLMQSFGFLALNVALTFPSTSLVNVIVSANSIVVLGLNFAVDGLLPCRTQLVGMGIILLGVMLCTLTPPPMCRASKPATEGKSSSDLAKCISFSLVGLLGYGFFNYCVGYTGGIIANEVEPEHVDAAQWQVLVIMWLVGGLPGVILALSSTLIKQAFALSSPADKGPIAAIVCSTVVTVSLYGHFVFRELLGREHAILLLMAVFGMVVSALGGGAGTTVEDVSSTGSHGVLGFLFAVLAMVGMSALTLLMRYSSIGNVATHSGYSALLLSQSSVALLLAAFLALQGQTTCYVTERALVTTVIGGLSQSIGIFAMNEALAYPMTSLVNVICSANPVVVLLLNLAVDGLLPGTTQLAGMVIILVAVFLSALKPPKVSEAPIKVQVTRSGPYDLEDALLGKSKNPI
ncbi:hypothetical protein FOL47_007534 [Perkinsus chesapeaki]|uniref:Uncharacterized protein n=1 Tax=Perkinsus chesapeaki TaxID=330153 RepID=A0A7J6MVL1_PERCH|nr:hypothetical protein FOL47_007534 [Perkinsus chesapeaki]